MPHLYDQGLAGAGMTLPFTPPGYQHVYHLYVVDSDDRDGLQAYLQSKGITALTHYPIAIHQQEGFPWGRPARLGSLPVTEESAASVLSLPMYPELTNEEVGRVIEEIMTLDRQPRGTEPPGRLIQRVGRTLLSDAFDFDFDFDFFDLHSTRLKFKVKSVGTRVSDPHTATTHPTPTHNPARHLQF